MSACAKALIAILVAAFLQGCSKSSSAEKFVPAAIPEELTDCSFFKISPYGVGIGEYLVVRCPNSSTTTTLKKGKVKYQTAVIDGEVAK
jgi:hypothetical protein